MPPKKTTKPAAPSRTSARKAPKLNTTVTSDEEVSEIVAKVRKPRSKEISWSRNPGWTHSLIAYLKDHDVFRLKLFSDSARIANSEGRKKQQAKDGKLVQYAILAEHVFGSLPLDDETRDDYQADSNRYAVSLGGHLGQLKRTYAGHCATLSKTGAGLDPDKITPGSEIANQHAQICTTFPFWTDLHGLWQRLPNYNPLGVISSSDTGAADRLRDMISHTSPPPDDLLDDIGLDDQNPSQRQDSMDRTGSGGSDAGVGHKTDSDFNLSDDDGSASAPPKHPKPPPLSSKANQAVAKKTTAKTTAHLRTPSSTSASAASSTSSAPKSGAGKKRGFAEVVESSQSEQLQRMSERASRATDVKLKEIEVKRLKVDLKMQNLQVQQQREQRDHEYRMARLRFQHQHLPEPSSSQIALAPGSHDTQNMDHLPFDFNFTSYMDDTQATG